MSNLENRRRNLCGWAAALLLTAAAGSAAAEAGPEPAPEYLPEPGVLQELLPAPILHVEGKPRHILIVEKDFQLMHLFRVDGQVELVRTYPCTTGKNRGDKSIVGDEKTPEGVYFFTRYIDDDELPPLYGAGAFPMDYPNFFDRQDGRRGSGIWLHGVEYEGRVQKARDTRGCVAVANDDFDGLREMIELRDTPIVVLRSLEWRDPEAIQQLSEQVRTTVEGWRNAWQGQDIESYIAHYAEDFRTQGMDREAWRRYKDQFNRRYDWIQVDLEDVGIFQEAPDRVQVQFRQAYASDRFRAQGLKRLFLRRVGDSWKIWGEQYRPLTSERIQPEAVVASRRPATPPPATPAPKPPAPSGGEAAAGGVSLEDISLERGDGFVKAAFLLANEADASRGGYLTLAVLDPDGRPLGNWPRFATLRGGEPTDYRRGEWWFAQTRTHVDAAVPVSGAGAQKLLVLVHDRSGRLLLRRELGL